MSKVKSSLAFVALLLCGGAWAAEPLAVWNGFTNLTGAEGYTLTAGEGVVDSDGVATIADGKILRLDKNLGTAFTVVMEVEDIPGTSSGFTTLIDWRYSDNSSHLSVDTKDSRLRHIWNNGDNTSWGQSDLFKTPISRSVIAVAYSYANGGEKTYVNGTEVVTGGAYSRNAVTRLGIGGYVNDTPTQCAVGMKVYRLALYNGQLSADEVAEVSKVEPAYGKSYIWSNLASKANKTWFYTRASGAFSVNIPATADVPAGTVVAISKLKFGTKASGNNWSSSMTINGVTSSAVTMEDNEYDETYNKQKVYTFATPVLVEVGKAYAVTTAGSSSQFTAVMCASPIDINIGNSGCTYCAVEGAVLHEASVGDEKYNTVAAAIAAAGKTETTITLMSDGVGAIEIPANITIDTNGHNFTGTITGAGKIVFNGGTLKGSSVLAEGWTGVCSFKNFKTNSQLYPDNFANESSSLEFNGVQFFIAGNNNVYKAKEIILTDDGATPAWTVNNGWWNNLTKFKKLTGTGSIYSAWTSSQRYSFASAEGFTGSLTTYVNSSNNQGPHFFFGDQSIPDAVNGGDPYITILANGSAKVVSTATWKAKKGVEVKGTISGTGTIDAPLIFGDGATIDITGNAEDAALTLTEGKTVTFNGAINLVGTIDAGTVVLKGLSSEPDLSFMTVSVNGSVVAGAHLYYEEGALKYSNQVSSVWTPNATCIDGNGIFDWTATDAWKDTSNADATWSVTADAENKPDVYIDATQIKGVKITGQVYVGNVTVVGTLTDDQSFQFHNHTGTVDGESEVEESGDCLHAANVNLTGLVGGLGMKVPITGDIAFGSNTRLVFVTGTDENPSKAYGYTFVDRGGSIAVEGSGKFVVPSSMYATSFAPTSGAKLVYDSNSDVTVSGTISGAGSVVKEGTGTLTFSASNTYTGGTIINNGTLAFGTTQAFGNRGSMVTVNPNGTLDAAGVVDYGLVLDLAGGTLTKSRAAGDSGNIQFRKITLSADSTINLANNGGIIYDGHNATTLELNNHKLTKLGTGTFLIVNTTVSDGTIEIGAGSIKVEQRACTLNNVTFTVPSTAAADMIVQNATLTTAPVNTVFQQAERTGGETIYAVNEDPSYVLGAGNSATLKENDVVVFDSTHYTGAQWGSSVGDLTSHDVTVNISMNWKSNYAGTMTIGSGSTVHLYAGNQGSSAFSNGASISGGTVNLATADIPVSGIVSITSAITGSGSFKLSDGAQLTVANKLAEGKVVSGVTGRAVCFNEATKTYELEVAKAFEAVPGSSASGWFSDWGGEKDGAARSVVTGTGMQSVRIVHRDGDNNNQKWHPYYNLSSKNAYTMSVYGTTDLIEPEAGKYKVLWSMGNPSSSHILAKDGEGNIVFFKNSNGDRNTGTQSNKISAGKLSGYHLITVTFSTTKGAAIWVDGEKKASDDTFTTAANNGLQIGGVFQGTYDPMKQGVGYVPTYIWAAEAIAPDAQIAALSAAHPATTTFNANVNFETAGAKLYLPSMTNTSGNLFQVKKGTLVVPKDVTATLDNIEFGDSRSSSYGLELDGTLNINKSSTGNCTDASVYADTSQNNGVLFGEWEGTGTYNIRGTFSAPNAWVDLIHDAGNQTFKVNGGTFTVKGLTAKKAGATIELTNGGTLNLGTNPSMENIRIVKNLTNGTVNCTSGAEYDELNVLGDVTLKYGNNSQSIRKLTIAKDATATLSTNNDQLNYAAVVAHVKGTLDCGTTRQTLFDGSKIYLYNGGTITGTGSESNGVTVALDTDRDNTGIVLAKNEDNDSKVATLSAPIGAHDANAGNNTITVQEGAGDVILSIPNAASLNGRMPCVIDEGVNVKFGNDKSLGAYTSLTINGNVVLDENVTEETTLVTAAEGKTITLGAGVKVVDPSLNELTRTVLVVEGRSLVAKTGETLITIDGNEYVSIDVALKHLHQDSTVELGTGVTLEGGLIKHGDETFNPLDYLGYEIVVNEETGAMTANRVFEGSSEVGLMISEICPKVSAWDENHCDAGWLEVVNTSKKWVQFKDYSFARFNRGKEVKKLTDWKNNVTKALAPGERLVIKTSEEYPNADDKSVTQYGEDLGNVIVLAAKVNPKKYPLVILTKGGKAKQNCVVPVDVPEDKSVCYDGAKRANNADSENGAIVSYITTASKGEASNFTDAIAVGPQITSLYAVKDAPDPWIAFPQATVGSDYTVTLPVNPVYGGNANNAIESVKLIYRIDYNNEVVVDTPMTKVSTDAVNGDMYTGTIPGTALTADGQLVRWAVKITDVGGNEWRSPSFNNPEDGFEYYGTITTPTEDQLSGGLNTMHLFADPDEVADGIGTQNTKGGNCLMNRDADDANYKTTRHPYGAYVGIYDSETGKYYDKVRIDKRGRTTGTMTKKAHGLKFAKAQPFIGTDALTGETIECRKSSFTAEFGDPTFIRQELAFEVMRRNGVKAPFHYPVRLNLNGQFYQLAFHSERFSDELIEDFYGLDGKGYAYKNVGPFHNGANNSSERKTPDDGSPDQTTNDPVLKAFCDTLNGVGSINENTDFSSINEFSADLSKVVAKSFDLPTWINYMAATKITAETDDVWANISAYYDVNGTGTWMPLAYDMNQSLGQWHFGDDRNRGRIGLVADIDNFKSHPFYGGLHIRMHKNSGETSGNPNYAYEAIFQNAKFRRLFLRRLRTIMDKEIGATAAATQAKETSALFTSAAAMVAKINELGLEDRKIWTDYANVNFDTNADCSGNGSADKIWVWNQEMTENLRTPEGGLADLWTNYVKPRRAYLYGKHLASYTGEGQMEVGYGLTKSAGIPDAQSPIENLVNGIDATYNETLGVIVISNTNGEAVDMSGWELRGPIAMTLPMGTVIDQGTNETPATLYVTADRKALVTSLGDSIGDQLIVGNGTANAVDAPISLRTDVGVRVVGEPTAQELYLRVWGFSGQPNDCNDEGGEFVILTNIGEEELDASGAIFHSLKAGTDPTTDSRCKIVLPQGTMIAAGATLRLNQDVNGELAWEKMTDGDLDITLYDSFGSPIQSWKTLTQKSIAGVSVKGTGKYAKYDFDNEAWTTDDIENSPGHWFEGSTVSGAHLACIYIQATSDKAITFDNPTMKGKSRIKVSGAATVTIDGTLTMSGVSTGIKSTGNLVFTDGSYTITSSDDCIQADGDITINGGTFICHSTGNDGIDANGDIIINGGTIFAFTAATETDGNKSTGLDVNEGHSITINGGTIIATSATTDALNALDVKGSQAAKVVAVEGVSGQSKAIGDILVTFPEVEPTAVLVSKPGMTSDSTVEVEEETPGTVEIVAEDAETDTPAVHATVPASWKSHAAVTAGTITEKQAAEAFVLGLAEPTEKPMVSSEQTAEADSIRIVDNVAPRFGTGVTVKRTLFVGTTPGEEAADNTIEETNGGFTVPLPTEGSKVKYIKIKYSFK